MTFFAFHCNPITLNSPKKKEGGWIKKDGGQLPFEALARTLCSKLRKDSVCHLPSHSHREKHLLLSGDNYGRDLPSVQNLQKKQVHFESELEGHEVKVQQLLSSGTDLETTVVMAASEIKLRCGRLQKLWLDLSDASEKR